MLYYPKHLTWWLICIYGVLVEKELVDILQTCQNYNYAAAGYSISRDSILMLTLHSSDYYQSQPYIRILYIVGLTLLTVALMDEDLGEK